MDKGKQDLISQFCIFCFKHTQTRASFTEKLTKTSSTSRQSVLADIHFLECWGMMGMGKIGQI